MLEMGFGYINGYTHPSAPMGRRGRAQGGLARLAQARQNRPGKGELDLTDILIELYGTADAVPYLPAVPQEGRDVEIVLADGRQGGLLGLAWLHVRVDAD